MEKKVEKTYLRRIWKFTRVSYQGIFGNTPVTRVSSATPRLPGYLPQHPGYQGIFGNTTVTRVSSDCGVTQYWDAPGSYQVHSG